MRTTMDPIRKQSTYLKTLFFLYFVGFGIGSPYFSIFYKHILVHPDGSPAIGLIGLIFFVMPLVSLIANIPAGILADQFQSGEKVIFILCLSFTFFAVLIGLAGEDFARSWELETKFLYIFVLLLFLNGCFFPIGPVIDAETLRYLNRHSRREFYGVYRLWGTYGWSVSTILMGVLLYQFHHDPLIFYGAALSFTLLGIVSRRGIASKPAVEPLSIPWYHLKKDRFFQGFLVFMLLIGVVFSASYIYTGYFFDDVMKSPLEIGLILGTWTILEIPVMKYSQLLLDRFGNHRLIVAGLFLNGIRLLLFSLFTMETPFVWKWAAALLQGPGFGLLQIGMIDVVDRQAHPAMRATYLSIAATARMSLASALGGILGSWLIAQGGGALLMQVCGVGSIALILFFVMLVRRFENQG